LSPERVVHEVTELVRRYSLEEVSFLDSNFPVDVKRAVAIARGFIQSRIKFCWTFQASTDLLCRMSDEEVKLLGLSGASHMGFGTESGSEEVLRLMNKPHQLIRDMHETARKCLQANIRVTFNLILGYPGESENQRRETLRIMEEISKSYPNVSFSPNVFTAYPGIPIWNQMKELGLKEPASLEEWAEVSLGKNRLPWFQGREFQRAKRMMSYFIMTHQLRKDARKLASQTQKRLASAFMAPLAWRLKHKFYRFPFDLWLLRGRNQLIMRRSLLTGSSLGEDLERIG
jgi:anaerobic magnesium-protoporphyrin IX monomethyl ester cyclase